MHCGPITAHVMVAIVPDGSVIVYHTPRAEERNEMGEPSTHKVTWQGV